MRSGTVDARLGVAVRLDGRGALPAVCGDRLGDALGDRLEGADRPDAAGARPGDAPGERLGEAPGDRLGVDPDGAPRGAGWLDGVRLGLAFGAGERLGVVGRELGDDGRGVLGRACGRGLGFGEGFGDARGVLREPPEGRGLRAPDDGRGLRDSTVGP